MTSSLKKFIKDSVVFSIGGWVSRFLGFFLVPVYTRIFSPLDYGILDLVAASVAFLNMGLQLGLDSSVTRFFCGTKIETEKQTYFSTIFWFKIFTYIPVIIIGIIFSSNISLILFKNIDHQQLIKWALISVLTTSLWTYFLQLFRLQFKSFTYSVFSLVYLAVNLSLTIYFVVILRIGVIGIYYAKVITETAMLPLLVWNSKKFILSPDFSSLKNLLLYGIPLVPSALAYFSMQYLDRYFINIYCNLTQLGLYAIAYKLSSVLMLLSFGFTIGWAPYLYSIYDQESGTKKIALIFKIFAFLLSLIALVVSLFSKDIIVVLTTPDYVAASEVIYIILFSLVVYLITDYFCIGIGIKKKTYHRLWAGLAACGTNLLLNMALIPKFGIIGAAYATLLSYLIYGGCVMAVSQYLFKINYSMKRFFCYLFTLMGIVKFLSDYKGNFWSVFLLKISAIIFGGFLLPVIIGFINREEIALFVSNLKKIVKDLYILKKRRTVS